MPSTFPYTNFFFKIKKKIMGRKIGAVVDDKQLFFTRPRCVSSREVAHLFISYKAKKNKK